MPSHVSKIAAPLVGLFLSSIVLGCGSGSGSDTSNTPTLTLAQKIEKVQTEASAKGCTVIDTSTNYSLLTGGENAYGSNFISKQGDQTGSIETVPSSITIKCGDQIHNFVFADDAEQSNNVKDANANPVGDINEFFKTDKKTEKDVEAFITEKIDLTSLCRFSVYPAFTGTIDDDSTETLTVAVSGKDCGTPKWYINGNSTPAVEGNSLIASIINLLAGENDITIKVTNPAGTNSLYIKRTQGTVTNDKATAIRVSISPTTVYPKTPSITGSEVVTDIDGNTNIVREWYDNGILKASGTVSYAGPFVKGHTITYKATADGAVSSSVSIIVTESAATGITVSISPNVIYATTSSVTGSEIVTDLDGVTTIVREWYKNNVLQSTGATSYAGPFAKGDVIKYKATADGAVSDTQEKVVQDSACSIQVSGMQESYKAQDDSIVIDALVSDIDGDNFTPSVSGTVPPGLGLIPSNNRIIISGTTYYTAGDCDAGYCLYPVTIKAGTVGSGGCETSITFKIMKYVGPPPVLL